MTTKGQHTPGPWHVGMRQAHRIIYDSKGWAVADATVYHGEESREEMLANARLIAAAPEMLLELDNWAEAAEQEFQGEPRLMYLLNKTRALLAKIEGK